MNRENIVKWAVMFHEIYLFLMKGRTSNEVLRNSEVYVSEANPVMHFLWSPPDLVYRDTKDRVLFYIKMTVMMS